MNTFKTGILMTILTILFIFVGQALGGRNGAFFAFFLAAIMNLGTYWFSDKIVLKLYGAHEVTEAEAPKLHRIVRQLSLSANLPMPKIYIMDNDTPNAFATGRNPQHAAVAVTTGLLRILSDEELAGVLGHELTHVKHRDILIGSIAATFAGAISIIASMARWGAIFGMGDDDDSGGNILFVFIFSMIASIAAMLIQLAISRSREYLADEGGAKISGNPLYLASALRKLETASRRIPMKVHPSTAHMFIVNPLRGSGVMKLFSTHPPIEARIARLEAMAYGRR